MRSNRGERVTSPRVDRHLFVVFGATGDLMRRKLLPSLYQVSASLGEGPPTFQVLGCARQNLDDNGYARLAEASLVTGRAAAPREAREWVRSRVRYLSLGDGGPADYRRLKGRIQEIEGTSGLPGHRVFYLALPSGAIAPVVRALGSAGLARGPGWTRLVVEKPFGSDLASAQALNRELHAEFEERSIYRIDHYLGKETVQNLLVFRFANMLFESVWNRDRVSHVEITVAEDLGVEDRAPYYDHAGALRDMV